MRNEHYGRCVLKEDCKTKKCENDTYILHGYSEKDPRSQFDALWFNSDNRQKFECYLPLKACEYDIPCILGHLHTEIESNSKRTVDIVGMSLGGMIADAYTHEYPDNVRKLGLITSFAGFHPWTSWIQSIRDDPKHIKNIEAYDWEAVKESDIEADVFEYNCVIDGVVGSPPDKEDAEKYTDLFCFHGTIGLPERMRKKLKTFIEK